MSTILEPRAWAPPSEVVPSWKQGGVDSFLPLWASVLGALGSILSRQVQFQRSAITQVHNGGITPIRVEEASLGEGGGAAG